MSNPGTGQEQRAHGIDRRDFLRQGAAALALGALPPAAHAAPEPTPTGVQAYRRLGRAGFEISDISFGSSRLRGDVELVHEALERGINYFDTAEGYTRGRSEETIGRALQGSRDRVFLASKVVTGPRTPKQRLMEALEGSLRRLRTDYVDVYFNHAVNDVRRLQNPDWYEFLERAKEQGKIRFGGMSGHGARLIECLDYALDRDRVDVILVGYNFGQDPAFYQRFMRRMDMVAIQPDLPRVLAKAKLKDVGVIAMKTLRGARLNDLRPYEHGDATFAQAAFRWVLSNRDVDALIVTMRTRAQIAEYLGASGAREVARSDLRLLDRYVYRNPSYCNHGCDRCADSCPYGVPIAEVLRTRMYWTDYRDLELARDDYAALGAGAAACLACSGEPCAGACPVGIDISARTRPAHRTLGSA